MFCGKCRQLRTKEINRYTIRKEPLTGQFYGVDESTEIFDKNPVVSRGLTKEEAINNCRDLNK